MLMLWRSRHEVKLAMMMDPGHKCVWRDIGHTERECENGDAFVRVIVL